MLVIDDECEVRETLADMLGMDGHDVQTATDGRDGLERIGRTPFDAILCD
jgi:CheY-like chemotaxis protein